MQPINPGAVGGEHSLPIPYPHMNGRQIRWGNLGKLVALVGSILVSIAILPSLLSPPAPPPLEPDIGLPLPQEGELQADSDLKANPGDRGGRAKAARLAGQRLQQREAAAKRRSAEAERRRKTRVKHRRSEREAAPASTVVEPAPAPPTATSVSPPPSPSPPPGPPPVIQEFGP